MSFDLKKCKKCGLEKILDDFSVCLIKNGKIYRRAVCKLCMNPIVSKNNQQYYENNSEKIKNNNSVYYNNSKDKLREKSIKRAKLWNSQNKEKVKISRKKHNNKPVRKIRNNIGRMVRGILESNGVKKNWSSFLDYVDYSVDELKNHLEKQFESWMTWDNYGKYDIKTWNDTDQSTWAWQIDHIIPQSILPYVSMRDKNFKKCWALNNLRPLNAKQNLLEGVRRIRHGGQIVL
jgi:hypothetical protein